MHPAASTWRSRAVVIATVGVLGLAGAGYVGASYAERQWGVTVTWDGLVRGQRLGEPGAPTGDGVFTFLSRQPRVPTRAVTWRGSAGASPPSTASPVTRYT